MKLGGGGWSWVEVGARFSNAYLIILQNVLSFSRRYVKLLYRYTVGT